MAQVDGLQIMKRKRRGVTNKRSDLATISKDFDIILLCETFLKPDKSFSINRDFNIIRSDRVANSRGGLAIAIRRVSVYRVPSVGGRISENTWKKLLESVNDVNPNNVLISGDFNSHHSLWGSTRVCQNGEALCTALDDLDFISLNNGKSTYVNRPNESPLILDLTFISPQLFTFCAHDNLFNIISWVLWTDSLGSDHFRVVPRLGISTPIACMDEAVTAGCPPSRPPKNVTHSKAEKNKYIPAPWWDAECDPAIEERKSALAACRRRRIEVNYTHLNKIEAKTRRILFRQTIQKLHSLAEEMLPPTVFFDSFPDNFQKNEFLETPFTESEIFTALTSPDIQSFYKASIAPTKKNKPTVREFEFAPSLAEESHEYYRHACDSHACERYVSQLRTHLSTRVMARRAKTEKEADKYPKR
ncbi:uncharacterized protein LOC117176886 [Belonocnema kinseyi]|uniref:uncharacterized protein LOC117176886 n=1 Tax=Belonocnema kinseyi TaxID=2817044 RepID=UPI00143CDC0D|nr:uncharacterized protein LOC117176886 [Belonocnema kinseyi]